MNETQILLTAVGIITVVILMGIVYLVVTGIQEHKNLQSRPVPLQLGRMYGRRNQRTQIWGKRPGTSPGIRPGRKSQEQIWGLVLGVAIVLASLLSQNFGGGSYQTTAPFDRDAQQQLELPPLQHMGAIASVDGEITIRNSTPEPMKILFRQDKQIIQRGAIPKCPNCPVYLVHPDQCPQNGYSHGYTLPPGTYAIDISWRGNAQPYRGQWRVEGGQAYSGCFTLAHSHR